MTEKTKQSNINDLNKKRIYYAAGILIFLASYSLTPLYTSNQNQYLLPGMAQAGLGSLDNDWITTIADPTPVFTFLVKWTFVLLKSDLWFHVYYFVLLGIYFISLLEICITVFRTRKPGRDILVISAVIIFFHSYLLRFLLTSLIGSDWGFLFDGGVASQKLLGTVFQPSVFGIFLVTSLLFYLKKKPVIAIFLTCFAATMHPTYLLSAALLVAGYMIHTIYENKDWKKAFLLGSVALILISPIVIYVFSHFSDTSNNAAEAYHILVNIRLPHHAQINFWFDIPSIIKISIIVLGIIIARKQYPISIPLLAVFILATVISIAQYILDSDILALIFPWRASTLLVPVCSAIFLSKFGLAVFDRVRYQKGYRLFQITIVLLLAITTFSGIYRSTVLFKRQGETPEAGLYAWVQKNSNANDKFLIPIGLDTFRTSTLRPVYIDYFFSPHAAQDVVDWYHRVLSANKYYEDGDCKELYYIHHDDKITHIVTESAKEQIICEHTSPVYADDYYRVYQYNE